MKSTLQQQKQCAIVKGNDQTKRFKTKKNTVASVIFDITDRGTRKSNVFTGCLHTEDFSLLAHVFWPLLPAFV